MRKPLFVAALVIAAAAAFAPAAEAQTVREIARIRWIGGFTAWNDTVTFFASQNAAGAITGGFVRVERKVHSAPATPLYMTGRLTARETYDLWLGCWNAQPWRVREVQANFLNVDLPDIEVTYLGRYTQRIRAGMMGPSNLPRVSPAMTRFVDAGSQRVLTVAQAELFVYEAAGGRAGYSRQIVITQSGEVRDVVAYASAAFAGQGYQKQGHIGLPDITSLKQAVYAADWWNLRDFPGNPSYVDGIDEQASYYLWGVKTTVKGGWPTNRTPEYQAVLDAATGLADALP